MNIGETFISKLLTPNLFTKLLVGFAALAGFYITHVVEDLRSGYTATYVFKPDPSTNSVVFHLNNISRSKIIEAASFVIKCADQNNDCFSFAPSSNPAAFVNELTTAPNFGRPINSGRSGPAAVEVCLGAIAASQTSIRIFPKGGSDTGLLALYDPWSTGCPAIDPEAKNLLLLQPSDPHAFFTRHFFTFLSYALLISVIILIITGILLLLRPINKPKEVGDDSVKS